MTIMLILLSLAAAVIAFLVWSRRKARGKLLEIPLSERQRSIVAQHVPVTQRLPLELRGRLEGKIHLFLEQIEFVGCDGLDVTEEMELSIAAQACLLVVNSDRWYKNLRTVLVYPGAFKSRQASYDGYVVTERETVRLGESWLLGPVILSWPHTERGALDDRDGHNVVLHEFAHQIDDLSGSSDGAPVLSNDQSLAEWGRVFTRAYKSHVRSVEHGRKRVIDSYGAESPQEYFAVAVEVFFERPADLQREEPAVYQQLAKLYSLNPLNWE